VLGTFFLVLVGAGGGVVDAVSNGAIGRGASVTAPGLMVLAIILFMGAVSGAHLNPAVTLGFALRGDFPWRRVPGYIIAELLGSTLAVLLLWAMFGKVGSLGATEPGAGISDLQAMVMELILTVGLFSVILGTASKAQNLGPLSALGVGAYIILAGLWSSPISGASMNPARSFGPDLVLGNFAHYWVYVVGPILGAAIAVGFAFILRGHGEAGGATAAQGALGTPQGGPRRRRGRNVLLTPDPELHARDPHHHLEETVVVLAGEQRGAVASAMSAPEQADCCHENPPAPARTHRMVCGRRLLLPS
jgi:aquaporin Z